METLPLKLSRLKRKEFKEVLRKGKGFKEDFLVLKVLKDKQEKKVKIGILVSKKVFKKAVQRNKFKRRLREIVRMKLPQIKEGIKLVFIPLSNIDPEFESLKKKVEKIFKKSKIIE
jgi:ribonuclease P protein component